MRLVALGLALGLALVLMFWCRDPPLLVKIKARYEKLLRAVRTDPDLDPRWEPVKRRVILTAMNGWSKAKGAIAFNVNKGYEIYLCMDGQDVNTAMHVLIHELTHSTVREYEHSDDFWKNFKDFKKYCAAVGVYAPGEVGPYCGENIRP